jgi:hypothetical protein
VKFVKKSILHLTPELETFKNDIVYILIQFRAFNSKWVSTNWSRESAETNNNNGKKKQDPNYDFSFPKFINSSYININISNLFLVSLILYHQNIHNISFYPNPWEMNRYISINYEERINKACVGKFTPKFVFARAQ